MFDANPAPSAASLEQDEFADCCQWIADAHALDDPQQEAQARAELFRHLTRRGWIAPPAAALLLQLQEATASAALSRAGSARSRC